MIACPGCHALFDDIPSPGHRYLGSSPGCWAIYGEVLEREYSDFRYARAHRLTVDAYAAQHPGTPSPQSIGSVGLHLLRLHWVLDLGYDPERAASALRRAADHKREFTWLEPPAAPGAITVRDVHEALCPEEHVERARGWAICVWQSWTAHHETIRRWAHFADAPVRR